MHSHHYLALLTKLAEDMGDIGGPQIMMDVVEESMRPLFDEYFQKHSLTTTQEKGAVGTDCYSAYGLGKIILSGNETGGEVRLVSSHIDEGWIRKWGNHDKPVNYFTRGFIAAMFGATFSKPLKSYVVTEETSIATGNQEGLFKVTLA
jgi:hypothetical protein